MCENHQICIYIYTFDSYTPTGWHVHPIPPSDVFSATNSQSVSARSCFKRDACFCHLWHWVYLIDHLACWKRCAQSYSGHMLDLIVYVHANIPFVMYIYSRDQNMYTVPCIYIYIIKYIQRMSLLSGLPVSTTINSTELKTWWLEDDRNLVVLFKTCNGEERSSALNVCQLNEVWL